MGPVAAPEDTVGVGGDEGFGEREAVGIVRAAFGDVIGTGDFDVGAAGGNEFDEVGEAGLIEAKAGAGSAEMVEDDGDGEAGDDVAEGGDDVESGVDLDMPTEAGDLIGGPAETGSGYDGIGHIAVGEVETDAADAGVVEGLKLLRAGLFGDNRDSTGGVTAGFEAGEGAGVVDAVDAGGDDDDAFDAEGAVEGGHGVGAGGLGGVLAFGYHRIVAKDVGVAVAGAGGNGERTICHSVIIKKYEHFRASALSQRPHRRVY